jgi:hypothetical protein
LTPINGTSRRGTFCVKLRAQASAIEQLLAMVAG